MGHKYQSYEQDLQPEGQMLQSTCCSQADLWPFMWLTAEQGYYTRTYQSVLYCYYGTTISNIDQVLIILPLSQLSDTSKATDVKQWRMKLELQLTIIVIVD